MRVSHGLNEVGGRPLVPRQHRLQCAVGRDHGRTQVVSHALRPAAFAQNGHPESRREPIDLVAIARGEMPDARVRSEFPGARRQNVRRIERRIETDRQQRDAVSQLRVAGNRRLGRFELPVHLRAEVREWTARVYERDDNDLPLPVCDPPGSSCFVDEPNIRHSLSWLEQVHRRRGHGRRRFMTDSLERREIAG